MICSIAFISKALMLLFAVICCYTPLITALSGCTGGGSLGCSSPVGAKWDRWDMAGSTYSYCYAGCHMPFFLNRSTTGLGAYAGVVGVDHYWTGQGVPCGSDGLPHEFDKQDELAIAWKAVFPGMRFLSYRILSAVPYDTVVALKLQTSPDFFVRWQHLPNSSTKGNGSVCYNFLSPCFNDPKRINAPAHNCSFQIRAAAYNWLHPGVGEWYLEKVLYRTLRHADGMWLDGNGYDNGAWMCSGICCGFGPTNSPHNQSEIDRFCTAQTAIATRGRQHIIRSGGYDFNCFTYKVHSMPLPDDDVATCSSKVLAMSTWAANHSNYHAVVAYGDNEGGPRGYNDSTAAGAVAAFLLTRGEHWLFGIGVSNPCNPLHYPVSGRCHSDDPNCHSPYPCNNTSNQMHPATAALFVTDYGHPLGVAHPIVGRPGVFGREYEKATVTLDCSTFTGAFVRH